MNKEEIYKLLDCSDCPHVACETCEITWTDKNKIREYIRELEHENQELGCLVDLYAKSEQFKKVEETSNE